MRVFVTGASGFIGSAVVRELLSAGHHVLGMVRSDSSAKKLQELGAQAHFGDLNNFDFSMKAGAAGCDAVIHTARTRDNSSYKEQCENDRQVIGALAAALKGTTRPLIVTSGVCLMDKFGRTVTENDQPGSGSAVIPRMATEEAAQAATALGVNAYIIRLAPSVHGKGDHGFIPYLITIARQKGISAYIGEGNNLWPAVNVRDAAALYRMVAEKQPALKTLHAVAEAGIPFKEIAAAIGKGLNVPAVSKSSGDALAHFGAFTYAGLDCKASSAMTSAATGWKSTHAGLLQEMFTEPYF